MQQETRNRIRNREGVNTIESPPDQSDCDADPHLEAVTVSKRIELEVWGLAQPLHLSDFFQNLPYLVHLYATGALQSHPKSQRRQYNRISPRPERLRCIPPS
jgi:hypothetical protein